MVVMISSLLKLLEIRHLEKVRPMDMDTEVTVRAVVTID